MKKLIVLSLLPIIITSCYKDDYEQEKQRADKLEAVLNSYNNIQGILEYQKDVNFYELCSKIDSIHNRDIDQLFIPQKKAAWDLRHNITEREKIHTTVSDYKEDRDVFGYYFRLDGLQEFIKRTKTIKGSNISGVRLYLGLDGVYPTTMMVPVMVKDSVDERGNPAKYYEDYVQIYFKDSTDIPKINATDIPKNNSSDFIYNSSIPCPTQCNN